MVIRKKLLAFMFILLFITNTAVLARADTNSSNSSIIDRIIDAITGFFESVINGFKSFFGAILDGILYPFRAVKNMFANVYYWSWGHLGPLGVVAFVGIAGLTAYVAIFWFKKNWEQITDW